MCCYIFVNMIKSCLSLGGIYLQGYMVREQPYGSKKSTIELKPPSDEFKTFYFCAENPNENKRWGTSYHPGNSPQPLTKWCNLVHSLFCLFAPFLFIFLFSFFFLADACRVTKNSTTGSLSSKEDMVIKPQGRIETQTNKMAKLLPQVDYRQTEINKIETNNITSHNKRIQAWIVDCWFENKMVILVLICIRVM